MPFPPLAMNSLQRSGHDLTRRLRSRSVSFATGCSLKEKEATWLTHPTVPVIQWKHTCNFHRIQQSPHITRISVLFISFYLNQPRIRHKFQCHYPVQHKEMMTKKCYLMQHRKIYANSIQSSKANINFPPSGFPSFTMSFTIDNVTYFIKKELYTILFFSLRSWSQLLQDHISHTCKY